MESIVLQSGMTTYDVYKDIKFSLDGSIKCPIQECPTPDRIFPSKRHLGLHLNKQHGIKSPSYIENKRYSQSRQERLSTSTKETKSSTLPLDYPHFCPDCGCDIHELAQARTLLKAGRK